MKLDELYKANAIDAALMGNTSVKSMLRPMGGREYYWKNFDQNDAQGQPEPIVQGMGGALGGNYGAMIEGNPRLKKYFGGLPHGSQSI